MQYGIDPSLLAECSPTFDLGVYAGLFAEVVESPLPATSGDLSFPFDSELRVAPPTISQLSDPSFDMGPYIESLVREEGESVDNERRTRAILRALESARTEGSSNAAQDTAWDGALLDYEIADSMYPALAVTSVGSPDIVPGPDPSVGYGAFDSNTDFLAIFSAVDPMASVARGVGCARCVRARRGPVLCCSPPGAATCDFCVFHKKTCLPYGTFSCFFLGLVSLY